MTANDQTAFLPSRKAVPVSGKPLRFEDQTLSWAQDIALYGPPLSYIWNITFTIMGGIMLVGVVVSGVQQAVPL